MIMEPINAGLRLLLLVWLGTLTSAYLSTNEEPLNYNGYKVLRVFPKSAGDVKNLLALESMDGVDFWKWPSAMNHNVDVMVAPKTLGRLREKLNSMELSSEILIDDVGLTINKTNSRADLGEERSPLDDGDHLSDWNYFRDYQPYAMIVAKVKRLAKEYKTVVRVKQCGKSSEGRPIYLVKMSKNTEANRPIVFIDAGHHAREWITHSTLVYLMTKLAETSQSKPKKPWSASYSERQDGESQDYDNGSSSELVSLLDDYDFWFLPTLNPDGYEFSRTTDRLWRKTRSKPSGLFNAQKCVGVDLNRNYPDHWRLVGASKHSCHETYAGPKPMSEPETRVMVRILERNKDRIAMYISLHAYSQLILTPYGFSASYPPTFDEMNRVGMAGVAAIKSASGTRYKFGPAAIVIYPASGSSDDYAYSLGVRFPFTIELPDKGKYGFLLPPERIVPVGEETFTGVAAMVRAINR